MAVPAVKDEQVVTSDESEEKQSFAFFDAGVDRTDLGKPGSFRYSILTSVLNESYDKAIEDLKDFLERPSDYPNFKSKITRFINHAVDLIYAIKAKRSFPGINSLTRAKQQELREKFKGHLRELQYVLRIIEKIQGDLRVEDVRSTIYVVKALWISGFSIILMAFWMDIFHGLAKTSVIVFDDAFSKMANWLADKVGF